MITRRRLLLAAASAPLILPRKARAFTLIGAGFHQTYVGIEDIYGQAIGVWSLRAASASAAAAQRKAIQLTRASDSTTMDIHVLTSGDLDVASATTFLSGTTGVISIWYDQSGNGYHHTVPSGQAGPAFTFNAIGSLPGATFDGSTTCLTYQAGIPNVNKPTTYAIFATPQMAATHNINYTTIDSVGGGQQGFQVDGFGSNAFYGFNGGVPSPANIAITNNAAHAVQYLQSGASSSANIDGTTTALNFSSSVNPQVGLADAVGCTIAGTTGPYSNFFKGLLFEQGVFAFDGTAQYANANSNQTNYWTAGAPAGFPAILATGWPAGG